MRVRSIHAYARELTLGICLAAAGCTSGSGWSWRSSSKPHAPDPVSPPPTAVVRADHDAQYYVRYDVLRVEVPPGAVSRSETLWNHVDESVLDFATARRLRINGFRIGLTEPALWPAIKAVLESVGAAQAMQVGLAQTDMLPFAIQIDPAPRDRTVFLLGPDNKLEGTKFVQCLNFIRIEHTLDPDSLSDFRLRLIPEIRHARPRTTLTATDAGLREVPVYEGRLYGELSMELDVPEHAIVVIGPSRRAHRKFQIGTEFLCDQRNGREFERVLFITPRLTRFDLDTPSASSFSDGLDTP